MTSYTRLYTDDELETWNKEDIDPESAAHVTYINVSGDARLDVLLQKIEESYDRLTKNQQEYHKLKVAQCLELKSNLEALAKQGVESAINYYKNTGYGGEKVQEARDNLLVRTREIHNETQSKLDELYRSHSENLELIEKNRRRDMKEVVLFIPDPTQKTDLNRLLSTSPVSGFDETQWAGMDDKLFSFEPPVGVSRPTISISPPTPAPETKSESSDIYDIMNLILPSGKQITSETSQNEYISLMNGNVSFVRTTDDPDPSNPSNPSNPLNPSNSNNPSNPSNLDPDLAEVVIVSSNKPMTPFTDNVYTGLRNRPLEDFEYCSGWGMDPDDMV